MRHAVSLALAALLIGASGAGGQSAEEIHRLATLGRVWGFLKYFHPAVAAGPVDWDSVLVAAVPRVRAARTNADLDVALASLLDAAGEVGPCASCRRDAPDSMRVNSDLRWLTDSTLFGAAVSRRLVHVRDNRHQGSSRYVKFGAAPVFAADTGARTLDPSEGQRLLALFRFWNAMRYYYPYLYVNGGDWTSVLGEFIPRMVGAADARAFQLTVRELSTRLHDSHVEAVGAHISRAIGLRLPSFDARWIDGRIVVWELTPAGGLTDTSGLRVGDVITHVGGEPIAKRRNDMAKYVAAGNPASFEYRLVQTVLKARADSATYVVERDGVSLTRTVPTVVPSRPAPRPLAEVARVLPQANVGYIDMDLERSQVDSAVAIVRNTDGIVLDLRSHARLTAWRLAELLFPATRPFATATLADSTHPGQVVWFGPAFVGPRRANADAYRGRLAILVDERTVSQDEYSAMALRTAPESRVIGSQTAGADGNLTNIDLPGKVRVYFTGLGIYYPDGRPTQRVGIVPDIEIRPSLAGVRAGRDEVLERAIQYIRTGN